MEGDKTGHKVQTKSKVRGKVDTKRKQETAC